jgi:hypothetical protein
MPGRVVPRGIFCVIRRYIKAERTIKLMRNPAPCRHIAARAIVSEFTREAAAAVGKASMRFAANGAVRRRGYAGNIQMGVIVWIGNVLQKYISAVVEDR